MRNLTLSFFSSSDMALIYPNLFRLLWWPSRFKSPIQQCCSKRVCLLCLDILRVLKTLLHAKSPGIQLCHALHCRGSHNSICWVVASGAARSFLIFIFILIFFNFFFRQDRWLCRHLWDLSHWLGHVLLLQHGENSEVESFF